MALIFIDFPTGSGIGGSRGGREGRTPPPGRPNSFDFMQFSGKFGVFTPPPGGFTPPLGKILDPPLSGSIACVLLEICEYQEHP